MTTATLPSILPAVIDLVQQAGIWLAAEFSRPNGPRSSDNDTAPIDTEIELFLRERLTGLLSARFVGEEEGVLAAEANGYCWVVDPHDGTRAFLEGRRGSAISVALLRQGTPVLAVVYAPTSPDRGPDMIAWAEGAGIARNGTPVLVDLSDRDLATTDVVFLNHGAGQRPVWHATACALHAAAFDRLSPRSGRRGRRHCHRYPAAGECARYRRWSRPADGSRRHT